MQHDVLDKLSIMSACVLLTAQFAHACSVRYSWDCWRNSRFSINSCTLVFTSLIVFLPHLCKGCNARAESAFEQPFSGTCFTEQVAWEA